MFDRKTFFDGFKKAFDPTLEQSQVDGLNFLLSKFESDPAWDDIRDVAYSLATIYHETAATFQPIEEYGHGRGRQYGTPDPVTGKTYFGRGYVQLTWKSNYQQFGKLLGVDLVNHPELALEPETAFHIMAIGMRSGLFTGHKLYDYIHGSVCDYREARRIINGLDKASIIASYAKQFETLLTSAAAPSMPEQITPIEQGDAASPTKPASDQASSSGAIPQPPSIQTVTAPPVPLYVKIGAVFTFLTGLGVNAGTLIQQKLSELKPLQVFYCIAALGLCYFAVEFLRRERKAKAQLTNKLVDSAADPLSNTVEVKK